MTVLTRRSLLASAGLLATAELVTACTPAQNEPAKAAPTTGKPQGKLNVWMHQETAFQALFPALVQQYQRDFPDVDVTPQYIPVQQYDTKLLTAFAGGNPPDVCKIGAWELPDDVAKGRVAPVNTAAMGKSSLDQLAAGYETDAFKPLTVAGRAYGLPVDYNTCFLFYRKDRFRDAGLDPQSPPTTWEQAEDFSRKLTNADGSKVGLQWLLGNPQWTVMQLAPLVDGAAGTIVSADGKTGTMSGDAGVKAFDYVSRIGNPKLSDPLSALGLFAKGTAAMVVSGYFFINLLKGLAKDLVLGRDYGVAAIPTWQGGRRVTAAYTWSWSVASSSANQYTAWHFLNYLQSPQALAAQIGQAGIITPVRNWQQANSADPALQLVAKGMPSADYGPQVRPWNEMAQALTDAMVAAAAKTASPQQAAAAFDTKMKSVL
jgi:ABC-type glycerol-3-phosphate transport system substrate-binding protein